MKRGYDGVAVIHGGFDAWIRLGLPTQPKEDETPLSTAADAPPG